MMQFVVIGLGSMGKRRIRVLREINKESRFLCVDSRDDRRQELLEIFCELKSNCKVFGDIEEIGDENKVDAAFVCTSPLSHSKIISRCLNKGWNVFTEINLVLDGYEENLTMAKDKGVLLYLSSTPMFRLDVKRIIETVNKSKDTLSYNYHVGQYLPDWHPWENYKDFFIGYTESNGCREIFAIELPWIVKAFGNIKNIKSVSLRQTGLEIDYNDCYITLIEHESGHKGVFIVDVVSRLPVRKLEIIGENTFVEWDGTVDGLYEYDVKQKQLKNVKIYDDVKHQEGYSNLIIEDDYECEVRDFLDTLQNHREPSYSFEQDRIILEWIDRIENER